MSPAEFRALPVGARVRLLCSHGSIDWRVGRLFFAGHIGVVGPLLTAPACCLNADYRHVSFPRGGDLAACDDGRRTAVIPENVELVEVAPCVSSS